MLQFYVIMNDGNKKCISNKEMRLKYTQELLDFYESKIIWQKKKHQNRTNKTSFAVENMVKNKINTKNE